MPLVPSLWSHSAVAAFTWFLPCLLSCLHLPCVRLCCRHSGPSVSKAELPVPGGMNECPSYSCQGPTVPFRGRRGWGGAGREALTDWNPGMKESLGHLWINSPRSHQGALALHACGHTLGETGKIPPPPNPANLKTVRSPWQSFLQFTFWKGDVNEPPLQITAKGICKL